MDRQLQDFPQTAAGLSRAERARLRTIRALNRLAFKSHRGPSGSRPAVEQAQRGLRRPGFRDGPDWAVSLFLFAGMAGFVIFGVARLVLH